MKKSKNLINAFLITTLFYFLSLSFNGFSAEHRKPAPWIGMSLQGGKCNTGRKNYGDYDYTIPSHRIEMKIVEDFHFTKDVENLVKGHSGYLEGDLDYTLLKIPNHHRALLSIIRYQIAKNRLNPKLSPLKSPVECYFQRAMNYNRNDSATVSLYAYYLRKTGHLKLAEDMYKKALSISPDNPKILYNYSLLLIDLKKYNQALQNAKKLYKTSGVPKGLKNKLIKLNIWNSNI